MIYFIHNPERGLIKIGTSRNVQRRFNQLQTGSCDRLVLLDVLNGDHEEEKLWHRRYSETRVRGEWFTAEYVLFADIHYNKYEWLYGTFEPRLYYQWHDPQSPARPLRDAYVVAIQRAFDLSNETLFRSVVDLRMEGEGDLVVTWMIPPSRTDRVIFRTAWADTAQIRGSLVTHEWYSRRWDGQFDLVTDDMDHPSGRLGDIAANCITPTMRKPVGV